jgi:30S ribosomal protein S31
MGRGDKKTRKGKIAIGSFGKTRPHDEHKVKAYVPAEKPAAPAEAAAAAPAAKPKK